MFDFPIRVLSADGIEFADEDHRCPASAAGKSASNEQ